MLTAIPTSLVGICVLLSTSSNEYFQVFLLLWRLWLLVVPDTPGVDEPTLSLYWASKHHLLVWLGIKLGIRDRENARWPKFLSEIFRFLLLFSLQTGQQAAYYIVTVLRPHGIIDIGHSCSYRVTKEKHLTIEQMNKWTTNIGLDVIIVPQIRPLNSKSSSYEWVFIKFIYFKVWMSQYL